MGLKQNRVSYPHTPSFLFPLLSKPSDVSVVPAAPIPGTALLSSSEGPAGLGCTGALGSVATPCSCHRGQVRDTHAQPALRCYKELNAELTKPI